MATISGMRTVEYGGQVFANVLLDSLRSSVDSALSSLDENLDQFNNDLESLDSQEFSSAGLKISTSNELEYNLSGSSTDTTFGVLRVLGSGLPVYNRTTGEWSETDPKISQISYSSDSYGAPYFSIRGSFSSRTESVSGRSYDLATLSLSSLSIGTHEGGVQLSGNLKVVEQAPRVSGTGQETEVDDEVSGSINSFEFSLLKSGDIYYRVQVKGSLSDQGLSITEFSLKEDGVSAPLISASKIGFFVTNDGDVKDKSGNILSQSDDVIAYLMSGKDLMTGTADADFLNGYAGADQINGGAGNDSLIGGLGKDRLTGSEGSDIFQYHSADESSKSSGMDTIVDFRSGVDKVDLSGFSGALYFGAKPTGDATGRVWFEKGSLMLSTNSDVVAEFMIKLTGVTTLEASDLIL